ncbi:MAG: hypothetical protein ACRD0Y_08990 [Terriglobales bacterium]
MKENGRMKKLFNLAALVAALGFFTFAFAAPTHVSGYVSTAMCAQHKSMGHNAAHLKCALSCFEHGSPAVLVERDGKVLKIANGDKVAKAVGHNARLTGTVANGEITVTAVRVYKARAHHHSAGK